MSTKTKKILTILVMTLILVAIPIISNYRINVATRDLHSIADYKEISYKDFMKGLENKEFNLIYLSDLKSVATGRSNVYAEGADTLVCMYNPNTETFLNEVYESGAVVRNIALMTTSDDVRATKEATCTILFLSYFLIYFVSMFRLFKYGAVFLSKELVESDGVSYAVKDNKKRIETGKTFSDIAGLKEVKKDMMSLVDFLVNKDKYTSMGAKLPKGVILYGPPGTGKTLLAKAVANEAGVPFHYMSGSEFIEKYVGVGAQRVRELFAKARKTAPCIIFIDEIDTIGTQRHDHQHSEDRKTINALLTEMDGFKESENIIVIGATNRLEDLDDALTRPGRFTDKFCVNLPETAKERREVIDLYTANKKFDETVDLDALSKELIGFSPAKIEALLNEAAIIAVQRDKSYISKNELDKAMYKILLNGHEREDQSERNSEELEVVAWHEAGHALMGLLNNKEVTKVTIISSTSGAGGVTFTTPSKTGLHTITDLKNEVKELYAGRVAEFIFSNNHELVTTGASNDIDRATEIINNMVDRFGMTEEFGLLNMDKAGVNKRAVLERKVSLAKELEKSTYESLKENYEVLKRIACNLIEKETITGAELSALVA